MIKVLIDRRWHILTYHSNAPGAHYRGENIGRHTKVAVLEQGPIKGQERELDTANDDCVADFRDEEPLGPPNGPRRILRVKPNVTPKAVIDHCSQIKLS